jgi:hypothetical protein
MSRSQGIAVDSFLQQADSLAILLDFLINFLRDLSEALVQDGILLQDQRGVAPTFLAIYLENSEL